MLDVKKTSLLVIDIQEKFLPIVAEPERLVARTTAMLRAAGILKIPVIVSEQYPKGLGPTVQALRDALPECALRLEKTAFGCLGDPKIAETLKGLGRRQIMVCGLETHICVNQTVCQLLDAEFEVHLIEDALASRSPENRLIGIRKMEAAGAVRGCVESALFELMRHSKHPDFKSLQTLIK